MTRLYSLTFSCNEGQSKSFFNSTYRDNWSKPICLHPHAYNMEESLYWDLCKSPQKEESGEYNLLIIKCGTPPPKRSFVEVLILLKTIFSFMAFIKRWWTFISSADFIYGYVIFDDLWELKPESSFPELRFAFVFVSIFYDTNFLASPVIRVFTMFSLFLDYSTIFVSSKACRHSSGACGVRRHQTHCWTWDLAIVCFYQHVYTAGM